MDFLHLLIVSDDPLVRAGLAQLLSELPGCIVDAQLSGDDLFIDLGEGLGYPRSDAILWDWNWETTEPPPEPLGGTKPIVALLSDPAQAAEAWSAGIRALLSRQSSAEKMFDTARSAHHGLIVLDPELNLDWFHMMEAADSTVVEDLTPRELEVLLLLAEGLTNKAIAQRLAISEHTVKFHVNAVMSKLGAQSRTGAVVQATRQGLISL